MNSVYILGEKEIKKSDAILLQCDSKMELGKEKNRDTICEACHDFGRQ